MKTASRHIDKYPNREKFITNFAIKSWLEERYQKVLKEGNKDRIKRYEGMTPTSILVEEPSVFNRNENYFRSTLIARKNGLLFPDPKIAFPTFDSFLSFIDPDKQLYGREGQPTELTYESVNTLAKETEDFPDVPSYALVKMTQKNTYGLLVYSTSLFIDLDDVFSTVFKQFNFQHIDGISLEDDDEKYPKVHQDTLDGYLVGTAVLNDILLSEQTITIDILNVKLIKVLMDIYEYYHNDKLTYNGDVTYSSAI